MMVVVVVVVVVSCSHSIAIMPVSCITAEIKRDIGRNFFIPLAFDAPVMVVPVTMLPCRLVWNN